jgi:hypothetical protein
MNWKILTGELNPFLMSLYYLQPKIQDARLGHKELRQMEENARPLLQRFLRMKFFCSRRLKVIILEVAAEKRPRHHHRHRQNRLSGE